MHHLTPEIASLSELMTRSVVVVERATQLDEVARKLRVAGSQIAVVTDGNQHALGVVARGDIVRGCADRLHPELTQASDVMSRDLVRCGPEAALELAIELMKKHRVSQVLVTRGLRYRLHGLIGLDTVARVAAPEVVADLVRALCVPRRMT